MAVGSLHKFGTHADESSFLGTRPVGQVFFGRFVALYVHVMSECQHDQYYG